MADRRKYITELNMGFKLNGENYRTWHKRVRMVLAEWNVQEHITKVVVRPSGELDHEQQAYHDKWNDDEVVARCLILGMIHDSILIEFEPFGTAKELWDELHRRYGVYTEEQIESLTTAFKTYRMNPEHSIRKHLTQMTNLWGQLRDAGREMTEEEKMQAILQSLPESWDSFKDKLAQSDQPMHIALMFRHLELEGDRLERCGVKSKSEATPSETQPQSEEQNPKKDRKGVDLWVKHLKRRRYVPYNRRKKSYTGNLPNLDSRHKRVQEKYGFRFQVKEGFQKVKNFVLRMTNSKNPINRLE